MADRRVFRTGKDDDKDIISLCGRWDSANPDQLIRVWKADAIRHIEQKTHTYYVRDASGTRADVHVVTAPSGKKHLRTDPNSSCTDNLDSLPDC